MRRLVNLKFDVEIDKFDLAEIAELIPEDSKIVHMSMMGDYSFIRLENENFKELETEFSLIPEVWIREDKGGRFTADFSEVLEEEPRYRGYYSGYHDEFPDEVTWGESVQKTQEKINEMCRNIQPENSGQMFVASTPTGHSSLYELYQKHVLPTLDPMKWGVSDDTLDALRYTAGTIEWEKEEPVWKREYLAEVPEEECQHEWKSYMGLSEQFEFCQKCDEKRK